MVKPEAEILTSVNAWSWRSDDASGLVIYERSVYLLNQNCRSYMLLYYIRYARKKIKFFIQRHAKKKFLLYHLFPFNTIKVRLKDEDAHELHNICEMLDKHGIRYRLTDGVALGFYREHHFIRHDTDLDFDLMDFDSLETLKEQMKNRGYKIGREVYYDSQIQQIVFYNKNQLIVDFSIW